VNHAEAEKLLGGYATGTFTEAERQRLFAAALERQDLFDALADEEALREVLSDPVARAQLLAALSSSAPPKVTPFWRHPGLLGAAAGLLVAATAGLAYLRSPGQAPPPLRQETPKATASAAPPAAQVQTVPAGKASAVPPKETSAPPPPVPAKPMLAAPAAGAPAPIREPGPEARGQAEYHQAEAQDKLAKKAEVPRPAAAAVMEVVPAQKAGSRERRAEAQDQTAGGVPGGVIGGVAAGTAKEGGVWTNAALPPPPAALKTKAERRDAAVVAKAEAKPRWSLVPRPDGGIQVEVMAPPDARVVLLKRGPSGVAVLKLQPQKSDRVGLIPWRCEVRLAPQDVLDLYLLDHAVVDPSSLPEAGPVDGFRVRIHPAAKKDPMP
jgi:hypothetical protein